MSPAESQAHGVRHALQAPVLLHRLGACALKRTTAGRNMALSVPWCSRGSTPPRLWLSECTQPRPFWKAIAPCIEALIRLQPRLAVAAVAGGALDVAPAALQAVEADAVGRRVEGRAT